MNIYIASNFNTNSTQYVHKPCTHDRKTAVYIAIAAAIYVQYTTAELKSICMRVIIIQAKFSSPLTASSATHTVSYTDVQALYVYAFIICCKLFSTEFGDRAPSTFISCWLVSVVRAVQCMYLHSYIADNYDIHADSLRLVWVAYI